MYYKEPKHETNYTGVSACELLQIAFIVLKLTKVINWRWIWVLAPTWGMFVLIILVVIFAKAFAKWLSK